MKVLSGESDEKSSDEPVSNTAILNVFRRSSDRVLKTAEVAEELPIKQKWTGERLNKLESEGRIHSKSAGRGRVWWLDDDEASTPVPESQAGFLWYRFHLKRASTLLLYFGIGLFGAAGLLLVPLIVFDMQVFAQSALTGATIAALCFIAGGMANLAVLGLDRLTA